MKRILTYLIMTYIPRAVIRILALNVRQDYS